MAKHLFFCIGALRQRNSCSFSFPRTNCCILLLHFLHFLFFHSIKFQHINRENILTKVDDIGVKRAVNMLRGKANAITADSNKFVKAPAAIDFAAYKNKLKFVGSSVDDLEKVYKNKSIPQYSATVSAFDTKKRAAMLSVVASTVECTKADLHALKDQLAAFEEGRITMDTSVGELQNRFPVIAKEIETEIKNHEWAKDSL